MRSDARSRKCERSAKRRESGSIADHLDADISKMELDVGRCVFMAAYLIESCTCFPIPSIRRIAKIPDVEDGLIVRPRSY